MNKEYIVRRDGELVVREDLPPIKPEDRDRLRGFNDSRVREEIWNKDHGICQCCGGQADKDNWNADHRKAHMSGGETKVENGQVTHPECNNEKGGKSDHIYGDNFHEAVTEGVVDGLVDVLVGEIIVPILFRTAGKVKRLVFRR